MNIRRILAIIKSRNREFFRDRAAFGWNFLFPFLIVLGFSVIFQGSYKGEYKAGVFPGDRSLAASQLEQIPQRFQQMENVVLIGFPSFEKGMDKLMHHKIDILIELGPKPLRYWVNSSSPTGYTVEKLFQLSTFDTICAGCYEKHDIKGDKTRYLDWLFPGILGMNMMFSALYGVGWVVVRYRKNGVLKRLKATPLTAFEYLSAQLLSRIFLLMFTLVIVWTFCDIIFSIQMKGQYIDLFIVFLAGSSCLTAFGLIIASRGTSEEFANGLLNFICWPMMFLSEVWFSIESAPQWVKQVAKIFPLTHLLSAARKVMADGAGLFEIGPELMILSLMTLIFLTIGASLFSWN